MTRAPDADAETVLAGGITNAGRVLRTGDTVRRPDRPTSAATRALLDHLQAVGFNGAPRHLGSNGPGREVLSFVPGKVAIEEPPPDWALTDEALVSVARLLRRFHDAVDGFDASGHEWPRAVPPGFDDGLVCHNDPNLDNVVFSGGHAVALIDWDLAGPGSPVWDVACAARLWAPLRDERDTPHSLRGRSLDRLRLFADAYGLPGPERDRVPEAARLAHEWAYDVVREAVDDGHPGFGDLWRGGGRHRAERTTAWLLANARAIRQALRRPA